MFQPFHGYLSDADKNHLIEALGEAGLVYSDVRALLFDGIKGNFFGLLPDRGAPLFLLRNDLNRLSLSQRLRDGTVPLLIWLRNAAQLTAGTQASAVFESIENRLKALTSGAPQPTIDAGVTTALLQREAIIGEDDSLPVNFLRDGAKVVEAVAKIFVPRYEKEVPRMLSNSNPFLVWGTSWLVAPDIVMTNHHVISARESNEQPASEKDLKIQAENSWLHFDFDTSKAVSSKVCVEELMFFDETLDFALLRLGSPPDNREQLLVNATPFELPQPPRTMAANIIQHPRGEAKRAALRNNRIFRDIYPYIEYFSDTDEGSSGAPVCNDFWQVIALHQGSIRVENTDFQGRKTGYVNQGIQMTAIWKHIQDHAPEIYIQLTKKC